MTPQINNRFALCFKMENVILESLAVFSSDIQQRIRIIEERLKNKKPGFRSAPPNLISNQILAVEQANRQAASKIESLPWKGPVMQSSKLSQELDEMLSQTVNRSLRLRSDLKNMADRLGCEDKSDSLGNYIAVLKIPLGIKKTEEQKFPYSQRGRKHTRHNTETQAFESENCYKSTDKNKQRQAFPTSDWQFKSDLSCTDAKFEETPKSRHPSIYVQPQEYLTMLNKTDMTGIEFSKEAENDQTLNSCSILQSLQARELKIASVNQYMYEYLAKKREQDNYKSKPAFLKYMNKMEKRINEVAAPPKQSSVRIRSSSSIDKQLQVSLQLQNSLREKLLKKIYQMRDRERYH